MIGLLGVTCVRDRVVKTALKMVLEPILDKFFLTIPLVSEQITLRNKPLKQQGNKWLVLKNLSLIELMKTA